MNATTGQKIDGIELLRQRIADVLTTPLGTRVGNRAYGSRLFQLVDAPMNRTTIVEIIAATADAIGKWVPTFRVKKVQPEQIAAGVLSISVQGDYLPEGREVRIDGIQV